MTANKAIQVAQFATIATIAEQCIGDPWMQIIPPIYEFGRDYTLLTPNLTALSGCSPIHYFTVIVKDADKSGIMVNKVKVDATKYQTIPGTGLVFQTVTIGFGEHRIQHDNTSVSYSVYTFGYGAFDSYALMAGTRMAPINQACTVTSSTPGDNLDNDCDGSIDEDTCSGSEPTKDCAPYQPVDGGWSPWSVAGPCTCPSGSSSGTEPHKRTCTKPVPMYNGWQCDTSVEGYTKEVNCICTPVNGSWTEWTSYGACSATCGSGKQIRTRSCTDPFPANGGNDCPGDRMEEQNCNSGACPTTTTTTTTTTTISSTTQSSSSVSTSGSTPTQSTTSGTTTTQSSTSGSNPTQSGTTLSNPTQSSTSGSNPTQSSTSGSNPTQSSTSGSNPTQSSTSGTNPTQSSTSVSNPTQSSTSGSNPTQSSTSGSNPTQSSTSGSNPTQSSTSGSNPTQSSTSGSNPTQSSTSGSNPTQSSTSGSNPTQPSTSGSNPTQSSTSGSNPTQSSTSGSNPTQSSTSGSNPTQSSTSGSNPTQSSTSGSNPTQSSTSGSNPTQSSSTASNSAGSSSTTTTTSNTNAAASSTTTSSTGSTASNSAAGSSTTSTTTSTTPLPIEGNLQAQEQVTQSGGGSNNAAIGAGAGAALAALGAAVGAGILYKRLKPGNKIAAGKKRDGDDEEKDPEDAIGNANLSNMPNTMAPANHALTSHF